jgi:hypothetical protein
VSKALFVMAVADLGNSEIIWKDVKIVNHIITW